MRSRCSTSKTTLSCRLGTALVTLAAALCACASASAQGTAASTSSESPAIQQALARQLQSPGPVVSSQGGSGGSGDFQAPSGQLIPSLATAFSDTWQLPDGPRATRLYSAPVNFKAPDGSWHAIENQLTPAPLGGYENTANAFTLTLPDTLTSSVSLTYAGQTIAFSLQHAGTGTPAVSGNDATYANVLPSTSLSYTSESTGVKETATLNNSSAPEHLEYTLSLPAGLTAHSAADGSIAITDTQQNLWFTIPAPVAYRPADGPSSGRTLPMSLGAAGTTQTITVDTSAGWLREMLATGPVAVDPSVTVSASQACTLNAESVKTSACSAATLQEGFDSTHQERHALLEFGISSIPQAALILNAKLGLYVEAKSTSNSKAVGVYRVTKPWTTGATWETYDGTHAWTTGGGDYNNPTENSDAVVNSSVGASTGWYYWYPTKLVQEWANTANAPEQERENEKHEPETVKEGSNNEGLIVKDQTDNVTQNLLTIASPTASANKPFLEVTYDVRGQGISPQYTQVSAALTNQLQMSVNVGSGDLMLSNQDMRIAGINGEDFASTRYFNSLDPDVHNVGRWRESMFTQLTTLANGDVYTGNGTGQHYVFIKQANGSYITPPGLKAKLCTSATTEEAPCPKTWPSGITYRMISEDPSEDYVDFQNGWPVHYGDKYEPKLTAGTTEGVDAITSWTDTRGRKIKYGVTATGGFYTEIKDETGGRSTKYELGTEAEGRPLLAYTDAAGKTTKYHYESGNLDKITDPKGNVTKFIYDSEHRIKEIVRASGVAESESKTAFEYKKLGEAPEPCTAHEKATIVKDPDWTKAGEHETVFCSNVLDEVEKQAEATGVNAKKEPEYKNETTAKYNPFGEQTVSTAAAPGGSAEAGIQNLNYDAAGVNVECGIGGNTTSTTKCPNRTSEEGKQNLITSYEYQDANNKFTDSAATDPQGNTITACYNGGSVSCTHTEGPRGSLSTETDALSTQNQAKLAYNANGTLASSTDPDGNKTTYAYTPTTWNLDEIKPSTGAGLETTTIKVDADSRPEVIEDGAKHKETITYDNDDRVTKIVYSGTGTEKTVTYEYDADGNLTKREDPSGTTKYTVDSLNRLTNEELPGSVTHSYGYDAASNIKTFTDGGGTTEYKYNGLGELEAMTEPGTIGTDHFSYDNDHRLTKVEYASKAAESYKRDPATGRVETITPEGVSGAAQTLSYAYRKGENNTQQIQELKEAPSGARTAYTYDVLGRLKEADTTGAHQTHYLYELDGVGNRLAQQVNDSEAEHGETGGTWTYSRYNAGNELECRLTVSTACTHNATTELSGYEYDAAGERLKIVAKGDTSSTAFTYNAGAETSALTPNGETAISLGYGGIGQSDLITRGSSATIENTLMGVSREIASGNAYCFERTPEGLLVDIRTPTGIYNPLYDAQGDIVGLVNASKELTRSVRYGPYGENAKSEGSEAAPLIFGYKGGYRVPGGNKGQGNIPNGLYHFGERYYDPTTGSWTQLDPQGGGYIFANDDPINESDPSGAGSLVEIGCVKLGPLGFGCGGKPVSLKKGFGPAEEVAIHGPHGIIDALHKCLVGAGVGVAGNNAQKFAEFLNNDEATTINLRESFTEAAKSSLYAAGITCVLAQLT